VSFLSANRTWQKTEWTFQGDETKKTRDTLARRPLEHCFINLISNRDVQSDLEELQEGERSNSQGKKPQETSRGGGGKFPRKVQLAI